MNEIAIRWMIRKDVPAVLSIEAASFAMPWSEDDFLRELRSRSVIGLSAEIGNQVVGYAVYELGRSWVELRNLAVRPQSRGTGVGSALLAHIERRHAGRRNRIVARVSERNLSAQLWFAAQGFEAVAIDQSRCSDGQDAYRFVRRIKSVEPSSP